MQLIFRHYFSKKSLADCGTLYQLRNVLGRTNVVQRPLDNFNACDDFFVLVVHAHILAAAMKMLGISDVNEIPSSSPFPGLEVEWMESADADFCFEYMDKFIITLFMNLMEWSFQSIQCSWSYKIFHNYYTSLIIDITYNCLKPATIH